MTKATFDARNGERLHHKESGGIGDPERVDAAVEVSDRVLVNTRKCKLANNGVVVHMRLFGLCNCVA